MADLLVYWRDCRRNRESDLSTGGLRMWHSSSRLIGGLEPGDRLWLISSGQSLGAGAIHRGYLVEVWGVEQVQSNTGESPDYPRERYAHRVVARLDPELTPPAPRDVDAIIRPAHSPGEAPIGRLLQGPRRLAAESVQRLARGDVAMKHDIGGGPRSRLDPDVIALGIRQPWAELILRGHKTIEVRTLGTNVRGPIYLYTSKVLASSAVVDEALLRHGLDAEVLTTGVIVGVVDLVACRQGRRSDAAAACVPPAELTGKFAWELAHPRRIDPPVKPRFLPYGVWFYPFRRRNQESSR